MPLFGFGGGIDFSGITRGINQIGSSLRQLFAMAKAPLAAREAGIAAAIVNFVPNIAAGLGDLLPTIGAVTAAVKTALKAATLIFKIQKGIVQIGISLMTLPLGILRRIHGAFQSIAFSVFLVVNIFRRFFKEPLRILREVQTATILAGESIKNYGRGLKIVTGLALKYAILFGEIAKGYKEVVKSGFSAAEAQEILGASAKYAGVFQTDLNAAIDQTIGILRAFNLPTGDSVKIVTALYQAVRTSRLSIADLTTALGYTSHAAAGANITFQETVTILSMLRDSNIRASRAGMALRSMIANVQRAQAVALGTTMSMKKAVEVLGIDWGALGTEGLKLTAVFEQFNKVVADGVTIEERAALRRVFGLRYQAIISELLRKGTRAYKERLAAVQKEVNIEEEAIKISESLSGTIRRLASLWTAFRTTILEQFTDSFTSLNEVWERGVDFVQKLGKTVGTVFRITAVQPIVEFVKRAFDPQVLADFEKRIENLAQRMGTQFSLIIEAAKRWIKTITGKELTGGIEEIIDLVGKLMVSSIEISEVLTKAFLEFTDEYGPVIMNILEKIVDFFKTQFPSVFKDALGFLADLADALAEIVESFGFLVQAIRIVTWPFREFARQVRGMRRLLGGDGAGPVAAGSPAGRQAAPAAVDPFSRAAKGLREAASSARNLSEGLDVVNEKLKRAGDLGAQTAAGYNAAGQ